MGLPICTEGHILHWNRGGIHFFANDFLDPHYYEMSCSTHSNMWLKMCSYLASLMHFKYQFSTQGQTIIYLFISTLWNTLFTGLDSVKDGNCCKPFWLYRTVLVFQKTFIIIVCIKINNYYELSYSPWY